MVKLKNTTSANITVAELIQKITALAPGEELEIDSKTVAIEIR